MVWVPFRHIYLFSFIWNIDTYPSEIGIWKCLSCDPICETCLSSPSECKTCSSNKIWLNYTCVDNCPDGKLSTKLKMLGYLKINESCTNCDSSCLTCDVILRNCTSCDHRSIYRFLINGQCLSECPKRTFADYETLTCSSCITNCDIC